MPNERTGFLCPKTKETPPGAGPDSRPHGFRPAHSGFTVLEMVVVLLIASTVMGVAVPKLSSALELRSVRAATSEFAAMHSLAKATAMQNGRTAQLSIDPYNRTMSVRIDTTTGGTQAPDTIHVKRLKDVAVQSDRLLLCFDARGLSTTAGACEPGNAVVAFQWSPEDCYGCVGVSDTLKTSVLGKILR